jgi:hypothetical protein
MKQLGFLLAAAGLFSIAGGIHNWDWFMNHSKVRFMCSILTRTGARIFYVVFGLGIVVMGILIAMGVIKEQA